MKLFTYIDDLLFFVGFHISKVHIDFVDQKKYKENKRILTKNINIIRITIISSFK